MEHFTKGIIRWIMMAGSVLVVQIMAANAQSSPWAKWYDQEEHEISGAMSGGFLAPQFSLFDLNENGSKELIVHDRFSGLISVWEHLGEGVEYRIAQDIKVEWPLIDSWMLIRDYNNDGLPDIFTQGFHGIAVYEGYRDKNGNGTLRFRSLSGDSFIDDSLIFTTKAGSTTNIFHSRDDIPVIIDVDGDGDLDIMTFDPPGTYLHYYENRSNNTGKPFDFILKHSCWGSFVEGLFSNRLELSGDPDVCPPAFSVRHAGGASALIDLDLDSVPDLLLGDRGYPTLKALYNSGSADSGFITRIDTFPTSAKKAILNDFPAPYVLDADQDGRPDIVIAHNDHPQNDLEGILVYRNTGRKDQLFEKVTGHWLQEEIIDLGQYTAPLFLFVNGNEYPDLLVAYNHTKDDQGPQNKLAYFKARGKSEFQLVTKNYLPQEMAKIKGGFQPVMAAGDIDGDGDIDILMTLSDGSCYLLENGSNNRKTFELKTIHAHWMGLKLKSGATPEFYDIDDDGDLDLLVGNDQGTIDMYRNNGTPQNPVFNNNLSAPENVRRVGDVRTASTGELIGKSSPRVLEVDHEAFLLTGSRSGRLQIYELDKSNLSDPFDTVPSDFPVFTGRHSRLALRNNPDGSIYLVSGNVSGGLTDGGSAWVKTTADPGTIPGKLRVYPNPVASGRSFNVSTNFPNEITHITVIQLNGREMYQGSISSDKGLLTTGWPPGMYIIMVRNVIGQMIAAPVVIQ